MRHFRLEHRLTSVLSEMAMPVVGTLTAHQLMSYVGGAVTIMTVAISSGLCCVHLMHYVNPAEQKQYVALARASVYIQGF